MARTWFFRSLAAVLLGIGGANAQVATNFLPATIGSSTTLSGTNWVQGTVTVGSNVVLTLEPGTVMLMSNGARLVIEGSVQALGTSNQPVRFTRATTTSRWKQIRFVQGPASRLQHCLFEYADCAGTHLDYYDNDCDTNTVPPLRNYHEAIVSLGSRLEFESCTFQNFPDSSSTAEGDAVAIISDDPEKPGPASAYFGRCRFIGIGQGIHSRHSPLLVEHSFFTGHHGDNDDIDMFGESTPPPIIRQNIFLNPGHDDMINPTRCSAIIIGNLIAGGDDHGIVLRDKCYPIVMNNVISNLASGGISIQNQCEALLINNTIVDCGRGLRLFDHTDRWTPPYCLFPGSGRATLLNSIIWNCPISMDLQESTYTNDHGSHVKVYYSLVQGGQTNTRVSASSTLLWGEGNLSADPRFTNDLRLSALSPAIDAGVIPSIFLTNLALALQLTNDFDLTPRPLDGNADGSARFDLGAFEFLNPAADSNADGIPDGWTRSFGMDPTSPAVAQSNPDQDAHTTLAEWIAGTNPMDGGSFFGATGLMETNSVAVEFFGQTNRVYRLWRATDLLGSWSESSPVVVGTGAVMQLRDTNAPAPFAFYRVQVRLP